MYLKITNLETLEAFYCEPTGIRGNNFIKNIKPDNHFNKIIGEITLSNLNPNGLIDILFLPRNKKLIRKTTAKFSNKTINPDSIENLFPKFIKYGIIEIV